MLFYAFSGLCRFFRENILFVVLFIFPNLAVDDPYHESTPKISRSHNTETDKNNEEEEDHKGTKDSIDKDKPSSVKISQPSTKVNYEPVSLPTSSKDGRQYVLVKVVCAGLNPVDCKLLYGDKIPHGYYWLDQWFVENRIMGIDFSGVIIDVPENSKDGGLHSSSSCFHVGDKVCGTVPPLQGKILQNNNYGQAFFDISVLIINVVHIQFIVEFSFSWLAFHAFHRFILRNNSCTNGLYSHHQR